MKRQGCTWLTSPDQFRFIYMQGHPEYNTNSLLKEYKREVLRFLNGDIQDYPPHPENYFGENAALIADTYKEAVLLARKRGTQAPSFPETAILHYVDNTWGDTAKAIFNNWLGLVYKVTHIDRHKTFMDGINPYDPLGLKYVNREMTARPLCTRPVPVPFTARHTNRYGSLELIPTHTLRRHTHERCNHRHPQRI